MRKTAADVFPSIPLADLPKMLGKPIHLAWARPGDVWILDAIDGDEIRLHTPKTHKRRVDYVRNACYARRYTPVE